MRRIFSVDSDPADYTCTGVIACLPDLSQMPGRRIVRATLFATDEVSVADYHAWWLANENGSDHAIDSVLEVKLFEFARRCPLCGAMHVAFALSILGDDRVPLNGNRTIETSFAASGHCTTLHAGGVHRVRTQLSCPLRPNCSDHSPSTKIALHFIPVQPILLRYKAQNKSLATGRRFSEYRTSWQAVPHRYH